MRRYGRWILGVAAIGAIAAAAVVWSSRDKGFDAGFDTRVARPAYANAHPVVLYDEGHLNTHTAQAGYRPFVELLRGDGYDVRTTHGTIGDAQLAGAAVLVIVGARGANDTNDAPAFTAAEIDTIDRWVRGGGSLLLITDHWPYGAAAATLAERFGVRTGNGLVEDAAHSDATMGASTLIFSRENGLLHEHPVTDGIQTVMTFTGQSIEGPPGAAAFMTLSDDAIEYPPTSPKVVKSGSDVRVEMNYGEPLPAKGRAQGLALEAERGRVVVLGESGMLRAQREKNGTLVGMNHPGCDNRRLALNIAHWLSRAL